MNLWDKTKRTYHDVHANPAWLFDLCAVNAQVFEQDRQGHVTLVWMLDDIIGPEQWPTETLRDGYIRLLAKYIVWTFMFPSEHARHCFRHELGEILYQQGHLSDTSGLQSYRHIEYPTVDQWSSPETPRFVKVTIHWAVHRSLVDA